MRYISTRDNCPPVDSAAAINTGMVPEGGLFVPESIPRLHAAASGRETYHETVRRVLAPLLTDFSAKELASCIGSAYNTVSFDTESVVNVAKLDERCFVMELWHGPTAAFKDVALQIMPHFLAIAKKKVREPAHTVILVATSGDTGKAALEGFKDCSGMTIIVFFPDRGVSEIQRLQMTTTDGSNTYAVAVKGNFDDCQTGVKNLFGDAHLQQQIATMGYAFSSANSINWGRLCPQIAYYFSSYQELVDRKEIVRGEGVNFCVPTGNFGNILAGYYAMRMGLPIKKLICASNKNNILADFFATGVYDRRRQFHRTTSPSMDILISSNLERFLFEITGHDAAAIAAWYASLAREGQFSVSADTLASMSSLIAAGWADEPEVLRTIGDVYRRFGYVIDPHTAVAFAVSRKFESRDTPTIIASTASPYKFSGDVVAAMGGGSIGDEFASINRLHELTGLPVHRAVEGLKQKIVRHTKLIETAQMQDAVLSILNAQASQRTL